MPVLSQRIDFLALISVSSANPNGDPINGGRPRTDSGGYGIISPVCIKRKLRDRLSEMGEEILITPPEHEGDVLASRAMQIPGGAGYSQRACERWFDVRAFGQVFAFPGLYAPGVRGAVSVQPAVSVHLVNIYRTKITRCIGVSENNRSKPSIGVCFGVRYGLYVLRGSISAYAAQKTGFSEEDSEKLRTALIHIFSNDGSSARPVGSMQMKRLYWWKHGTMAGRYSPERVFGTVDPMLTAEGCPERFEDYRIDHFPLAGLTPEIYEG